MNYYILLLFQGICIYILVQSVIFNEPLSRGYLAMEFLLKTFAAAFIIAGTGALAGTRYKVCTIFYVIAIMLYVTYLIWGDADIKEQGVFLNTINTIGNNPYFRKTVIVLIALLIIIPLGLYIYQLRQDLDVYVMPRVITTRQANDLREYLSQRDKHSITVKVNPDDREARQYADQIFSALKSADWDVTIDFSSTGPSTANDGLSLGATGTNTQPDTKHDPRTVLQGAFQVAHIVINGGGDSGAGEFKVFLLIGHRPLAIREVPTLKQTLKQWVRYW